MLLSFTTLFAERGDIVEAIPLSYYDIETLEEMVGTLLPSELSALANSALPINHEVDLYRMVYETINPHGEVCVASGLVALPVNPVCKAAMLCYEHGTMVKRGDAPSFAFLNNEAQALIPVFCAADGYVGLAPDYLGLGVDDTQIHPYIHAKSEATATVDLIRAAKIFCAQTVPLNGQLFICGYSQGGHAAMATHREIQELHKGELHVTASAPMAGPYDASGVQSAALTSNQPYPSPDYAPYVAFAYQYVYGNLFDDPSEVFKAPFDEILPPLFDGTHSLGEVANALYDNGLTIPKDMFLPEVVAEFESGEHALFDNLRDNDLYNWVPETPMRMFYCEADEHVVFENAIVAHDNFMAAGANPGCVEHASSGAIFDHGDCAPIAIITGKVYFDAMRDEVACDDYQEPQYCSFVGIDNAIATSLAMRVFPNPSEGLTLIQFDNPNQVSYQLAVHDLNGKVVKSANNITGNQYQLNCSDLASGMYMLTLNGERVFHGRIVVN